MAEKYTVNRGDYRRAIVLQGECLLALNYGWKNKRGPFSNQLTRNPGLSMVWKPVFKQNHRMVVPISFSLAFLINFYLCSLDATNLNFRVSVGFSTFQHGKTSSHTESRKALFVSFTVSWNLATQAQQLHI